MCTSRLIQFHKVAASPWKKTVIYICLFTVSAISVIKGKTPKFTLTRKKKKILIASPLFYPGHPRPSLPTLFFPPCMETLSNTRGEDALTLERTRWRSAPQQKANDSERCATQRLISRRPFEAANDWSRARREARLLIDENEGKIVEACKAPKCLADTVGSNAQ